MSPKKSKTTSPIANILRQARARLGISQQELANLSGVARITIANIEIGKNQSLRSQTIHRLAEALGLKPAEILEGDLSVVSKVNVLIDDFINNRAPTGLQVSMEERRWLKHICDHWGEISKPSELSLVFLLAAKRHSFPIE